MSEWQILSLNYRTNHASLNDILIIIITSYSDRIKRQQKLIMNKSDATLFYFIAISD